MGKKVMVNEAKVLKTAIETGKKPPEGLWVGGIKYNVTQFEKAFETQTCTLQVLFGQAPKKGIVLVHTKSQIVAGFYDEEKGQSAPNCKKATIAFGEYLHGLGY